MPELAVSTWSLHREMGAIYPDLDVYDGARPPEFPYGTGSMTLLDAPAAVAGHGIHNLEVCHFHFPRTDAAYLRELRHNLAAAGVSLLTLLVDAGDITAPDPELRRRDLDRIKRWIDVAAEVGAQRVRVIAGDASPDAPAGAVATSLAGLTELAAYAGTRSVRIITENWHELTMDPRSLLAILDGAGGAVGLCADFGNYRGPARFANLRAILPRASSIHAKADFSAPGLLDGEGFNACLDLAREARFQGTYVLIFDGPGEGWSSLAQMASVVQPYL
jgi:sugar phosphate isomerase/epimerase